MQGLHSPLVDIVTNVDMQISPPTRTLKSLIFEHVVQRILFFLETKCLYTYYYYMDLIKRIN